MASYHILTAFLVWCFFQQKPGRLFLRDLLEWKEFDEIQEVRQSIKLDAHYYSLVFAANKGLSWQAVAEVGKLTGELLEETQGVTLLQAIRILKEKLTAFPVQLSSFHQSAVFDYFSNTFLKHYWLYQFVMTRERDRNQTFAILEICAPPSPPPLSEGIDIEMWNYQQQLAALCAAEEEKQASILHIRETLLAEREHRWPLSSFPTSPGEYINLVFQTLTSLVNEVIKTQIQNLHRIIQHEIQTTFEILELKLQKKALMFNSPAPYPPPFCPDLRGKKSSKPQKKTQDNSLENEDKTDQKKKKK
uniref:Chromosome 8 open reading frame 74 n=1 Tax=Pseudonaja textilis TaxID=8673 RepID=A0A670ZEW8_PSETE